MHCVKHNETCVLVMRIVEAMDKKLNKLCDAMPPSMHEDTRDITFCVPSLIAECGEELYKRGHHLQQFDDCGPKVMFCVVVKLCQRIWDLPRNTGFLCFFFFTELCHFLVIDVRCITLRDVRHSKAVMLDRSCVSATFTEEREELRKKENTARKY